MDRVTFTVNGVQHSVGREVSTDVTLLDFIRHNVQLAGTKYMCREAGCGACIVTAARCRGAAPAAVNSCMVLVTSCEGWDVTTIEGVGNRLAGYSPIQTTLAEHNGTQCGYCTPGWVMAMHSLLQSRKNLTMLEIEQSFGSNICRCTGYRSILDAFKTFAADAPRCGRALADTDIEEVRACGRALADTDIEEVRACGRALADTDIEEVRACGRALADTDIEEVRACGRALADADIEEVRACGRALADADIEEVRACGRAGCVDYDWCVVRKEDVVQPSSLHIKLADGRDWFRVYDLRDVFQILHSTGYKSYMLVAGNTAKGVYPIEEYPQTLIDITGITQLKGFVRDQNLVLAAGNSLTETLEIFKLMSAEEYFSYLEKLYDHIQMVAHVAVRNIGTVAGNLMIKHQHREFPSDLYLLLETVGAQLTISGTFGRKVVTMQAFLNENMTGKVILNVLLPPLSDKYKLVTYKIMPRAQNAHAIVHAGFLYKLSRGSVVLECRLVFGGLSPNFSRARATEHFLVGKFLFANETLQAAIKLLNSELVITRKRPDLSIEYRRHLAIGSFYKGLLHLCPSDIVGVRYRSGAINIHETRPVSSGCQVIETNPALWPLTQPIPKLEALCRRHKCRWAICCLYVQLQCSGEAVYADDTPPIKSEVFISFALSAVAVGFIDEIDHTEALNEPGVIAFYSAKDVPGLNSFTPMGKRMYLANEEIFCSGEVKYYNQVIGMIVAETQQIADRAAKLVVATYSDLRKPVIDVKEARTNPKRITPYATRQAIDKGSDIWKVIQGSFAVYQQYPFCMETLTSISIPVEGGLEVHASTQYAEGIQVMTSRALNMEQSKINVYVRRTGDGYGYKISWVIQGAVAASLAALRLNRPVRFIQPLRTNTRAIGKRLPCATNFEVAVNAVGVIQHLDCDLYSDNGYIVDEPLIMLGVPNYNNCYNKSTWNYRFFNVVTDTASNSFCRSPGTLENIANTEFIMERIAYELDLDPVNVRLANLDVSTSSDVHEMWENLKTKSQYDERRLATQRFNNENRWQKRGLRVGFMRWVLETPQFISANLSVYYEDGSVAISHGGVEMGQGINTKAAQICAYFLKIPLSKIRIISQSTFVSPNVNESGGSVTSLNIGLAVQRCCEELLRRLEPIRLQMSNPTWEDLVRRAFAANVDLQTRGAVTLEDAGSYNIYGVVAAEVETDVITGQWEIKRVDLLEDVGRSVSPEIDIGQIEGAFTMGVGYWTCERMEYEPDCGEVLSDRTWNYWVPQARDIPQDFRVYFREKSNNPNIYLGAKATGEPATSLAVGIPLAIREAIASARHDTGIPTTEWFQIDGPYTTENICLSCATKFEDFKFY